MEQISGPFRKSEEGAAKKKEPYILKCYPWTGDAVKSSFISRVINFLLAEAKYTCQEIKINFWKICESSSDITSANRAGALKKKKKIGRLPPLFSWIN